MLYKVMVDTIRYNKKPKTKKENIEITKRLRTKELTLKEIIDYATSGYTIRPAILEGGTESKNFKEQQVFLFDVDDNTMQNSVDVLVDKGIYPFAMYPSFNYTEEKQKHRVAIVLDTIITDSEERVKIINYINALLGGDVKTVNIARYFYGTNYQANYTEYEDIVSYDYLKQLIEENSIKGPENNTKITKSSSEKVAQTIDTTGLEDVCSLSPIKNVTNIYNNIYIKYKSSIFDRDYTKGPENIDIATVRAILDECFLSTFSNYPCISGDDLLDKLKKVDLTNLFGSSSFSCIFHQDNNPSASIYVDEKGYYHYKCFGCDLNITLIDIIAYIEGITSTITGRVNIQAFVDCMLKNYGLKIIDDEFLREQICRINIVKGYTIGACNDKSYKRLKAKYPKVMLEIKRKYRILDELISFKMHCLNKYPIKRGMEHIFYCSTRDLHDRLHPKKAEHIKQLECNEDEEDGVKKYRDTKTILAKIDMLTYMGLIIKVDDKDIIDKNFIKANLEYKKNNNFKYTVQCFILPLWDKNLLDRAEQRLNEWKSSGATVKASSVLQYQNLDVAEEVKPKSFNKKMTDKEIEAEEVLSTWAKRTLKRNGFFLKKDYLTYAYKNYISEETALKIITSLTRNLSLQKDNVNKVNRKKYNIKDSVPTNTTFFA